MATPTYHMLISTSIRDSRNAPRVISAVPMIGKILYRPVREMSWPDAIEASMIPPVSGSIATPDSIAL